jgi:RNA polymerase sigma-70 factor (ECF subfamily)
MVEIKHEVAQQISFSEFYRDHADFLRRYLQAYSGNTATADDLLQETLIRISKGLPGFSGRSAVKTWAFSIAKHVAVDHFRKPEYRAQVVEVSELDDLSDGDLPIVERLVVGQMNACIRKVIDSLPDDYRSALILHELEGLTAEETAAVSECSLATAKIRIHRARQRLKKALENQCEFHRDTDNVLRCDSKG